MRKFLSMTYISMMAVMGTFPVNGFAMSPNIQGQASFQKTCAPWDGPAYEVEITLPVMSDYPNAHFRAMIWNAGLQALKDRQSFDVETDGSMNGTGQAFLYDGSPAGVPKAFEPISLKVNFQPIDEVNTGTSLEGFGGWVLTILMPAPSHKYYLYSIGPVIKENTGFCG